jgi:glutaredoxin
MTRKRTVEIFTAGCPVCDEAVAAVLTLACSSCDVVTHDMRDADVAKRAEQLGVRTIPAVTVDGELAGCCKGGGIDQRALRAAGIGSPLT